jgi:hypothetical protein
MLDKVVNGPHSRSSLRDTFLSSIFPDLRFHLQWGPLPTASDVKQPNCDLQIHGDVDALVMHLLLSTLSLRYVAVDAGTRLSILRPVGSIASVRCRLAGKIAKSDQVAVDVGCRNASSVSMKVQFDDALFTDATIPTLQGIMLFARPIFSPSVNPTAVTFAKSRSRVESQVELPFFTTHTGTFPKFMAAVRRSLLACR